MAACAVYLAFPCPTPPAKLLPNIHVLSHSYVAHIIASLEGSKLISFAGQSKSYMDPIEDWSTSLTWPQRVQRCGCLKESLLPILQAHCLFAVTCYTFLIELSFHWPGVERRALHFAARSLIRTVVALVAVEVLV